MPTKHTLSVNTDEVVKYARKLDLMSKKLLPNAVRNSLNQYAFETKKLLPHEARKNRNDRSGKFYKRFSRVQKATGFKINRMKSLVGMNIAGAPETAKQAINDQVQQQTGGTIRGRTNIPLAGSRVGGKLNKNVRGKFRNKSVRVDFDTKHSKKKDAQQRFISTAIEAVERYNEAFIKHQAASGKEFIYHVKRQGGKNSFKTSIGNIKATAVYSVKDGRAVRIAKPYPYTKNAAFRIVRTRGNKIFNDQAEFQLRKLRK